jgi:hypothetical protein
MRTHLSKQYPASLKYLIPVFECTDINHLPPQALTLHLPHATLEKYHQPTFLIIFRACWQ